jgi:hypothetical protein
MNCKPGDLAYVVVGSQSGCIVAIEKIAEPFPDGSPAWTATSREKLVTRERLSCKQSTANRFRVRDSWLRPISGVPVDDEVSEGMKEPAHTSTTRAHAQEAAC